MIVKTILAWFSLFFLLLWILRVRCYSKLNDEHTGYCTEDSYKSRLKFCPKVKESMSVRMGNVLRTRKSLKDFGYQFKKVTYFDKNQRDESTCTVLHDIETGGGFVFDVNEGDRAKNQNRYEELGEAVTEYVYDYLEKTLNLKRVPIPVSKKGNDNRPNGFFFMSENALKCEKLMILIHGSGVVRAGQWARSLIINVNFESGTMVPYIEKAIEEGFGVLITNGNHNCDDTYYPIKGSETPQDHFAYIWKHFIEGSLAKHIVIVAHSFGGVVVLHGLRNNKDAKKRIKAVAFTDSVHSVSYNESRAIKLFIKERTRNWVSSWKDLDTPLSDNSSGTLVSAGTTEHVWTSHYAKDSVFKFFKEKLEEEEQKEEKSKCTKGAGTGCGSSSENSQDENPSNSEENKLTMPSQELDKEVDCEAKHNSEEVKDENQGKDDRNHEQRDETVVGEIQKSEHELTKADVPNTPLEGQRPETGTNVVAEVGLNVKCEERQQVDKIKEDEAITGAGLNVKCEEGQQNEGETQDRVDKIKEDEALTGAGLIVKCEEGQQNEGETQDDRVDKIKEDEAITGAGLIVRCEGGQQNEGETQDRVDKIKEDEAMAESGLNVRCEEGQQNEGETQDRVDKIKEDEAITGAGLNVRCEEGQQNEGETQDRVGKIKEDEAMAEGGLNVRCEEGETQDQVENINEDISMEKNMTQNAEEVNDVDMEDVAEPMDEA